MFRLKFKCMMIKYLKVSNLLKTNFIKYIRSTLDRETIKLNIYKMNGI